MFCHDAFTWKVIEVAPEVLARRCEGYQMDGNGFPISNVYIRVKWRKKGIQGSEVRASTLLKIAMI